MFSSNATTLDPAPTESHGSLPWDSFERGLLLSSFGYGYVTTQIVGGRLAELVGGKWVYGLGLGLTALFTLLSPVAANAGFYYFFALRVLLVRRRLA